MFDYLPTHIETHLHSSLQVHSFAAGESIFVQEANAEAIYLVANGLVKVVRVTPEGHESIMCVRKEGDYFCPIPLLDHGPQLGTAVAISDVKIFSIDQDDFHKLCQESPEFFANVQGDCLVKVRGLLNRLETFAFRSIKERLAITLLREVRFQEAYTDLPRELHLTQKDLAGLVGASRERVSRLLKELERQNIVILKRGRIILLDIDFLKMLANEA